jgi:hypothetical protein
MNETQRGENTNQDRNGGAVRQQPPGMDRYTGIGYGTIPQQTASLAAHLVESWGAHASEQAGGEDKAGRQKLRRLSPQELVQQSCDTADLLFKEFNKRSWISGPSIV